MSTIEYSYLLPPERRPKYGGVAAVALDAAFCGSCAATLFKHLKRFFGTRSFLPDEPAS